MLLPCLPSSHPPPIATHVHLLNREQEQHTHQLSSVQERAAQLERKVATLEQQLAAASEAVSAKEQRLDQLSQQLSNLQVAFDCVRATATERHEELQLWREKHAKLDTAMQVGWGGSVWAALGPVGGGRVGAGMVQWQSVAG